METRNRTPEPAAEVNVEQIRAEVTVVGKQVSQTIERRSSLVEWKEHKPQLDQKIEGLKKRLQREGLKADAQKTAKAAADYAQAQEALVAIEKQLAGKRVLRAVSAIAGEVEPESKVFARAANMDELFAWAAELSARDRDALARRLASTSSEDVFARELHNYLATAGLFFEFKNVLADPKALRRDVRERVRAKRAADAAASATTNTDSDRRSATEASPVEIAERGVADAREPFPHAQTLQPLFSRHDLSRIKVQVGGPAADPARVLDATAYAIEDCVGFATPPDLHTAAHEGVHVVELFESKQDVVARWQGQRGGAAGRG